MRQLIMDGAEVSLDTEFARLGDLLETLNQHTPEGRIISHLFLDDREVMELQHEDLRNESLDQIETVRVVTSPLRTQVLENIKGLLSFLSELRPVLRHAGRELRYGAVSDASSELADCFEGMETVVRSIDQLALVLPRLDAGLTEEELKNFSAREGDVLGELVSDFQRQDWFSLADRLEFQLEPLIGRWHTVLSRVQATLKSDTGAQG